jgi:hypothetical protein
MIKVDQNDFQWSKLPQIVLEFRSDDTTGNI